MRFRGPNPFIGVTYHWLGGLASASNFMPFRGIKRWSWEIYWIIQGVAAWLIAPPLIALILVPNVFGRILRNYLFAAGRDHLVLPVLLLFHGRSAHGQVQLRGRDAAYVEHHPVSNFGGIVLREWKGTKHANARARGVRVAAADWIDGCYWLRDVFEGAGFVGCVGERHVPGRKALGNMTVL